MSVGAIIEKARNDAGMSRDELARITGLTARTIFRVERDDQWSRGSLSLIARALNFSFDALIHEIEGNPTIDDRGKNAGPPAAVGSCSKGPAVHEGE